MRTAEVNANLAASCLAGRALPEPLAVGYGLRRAVRRRSLAARRSLVTSGFGAAALGVRRLR